MPPAGKPETMVALPLSCAQAGRTSPRLESAARDAAETKRRTHRTSRLIAKLRGHGLITRVKNTWLYRLTAKGFKAMWPAVRFRRIDFPTAFRAAQAA